MGYFFRCFLPGLLLIALAFFSGAQADPVWGLVGFLPFFTLGVILIFSGQRHEKKR